MTPSNPEDSLIMTESTHPYADLITELYQQAIKFQESENFTEALACYQKLINLERLVEIMVKHVFSNIFAQVHILKWKNVYDVAMLYLVNNELLSNTADTSPMKVSRSSIFRSL